MDLPKYLITGNNEIIDISTGEIISLEEIKK